MFPKYLMSKLMSASTETTKIVISTPDDLLLLKHLGIHVDLQYDSCLDLNFITINTKAGQAKILAA